MIGAERAWTTYAFGSLIESGAAVAFGSDWSVAPATPIDGIYAAVTRRTLDDANPGDWIPDERVTVEQALRAYTSMAAYASFEEGIKGMIRPGMLADMVLLDRDLTRIAPEDIRKTKVLKPLSAVVLFTQQTSESSVDRYAQIVAAATFFPPALP